MQMPSSTLRDSVGLGKRPRSSVSNKSAGGSGAVGSGSECLAHPPVSVWLTHQMWERGANKGLIRGWPSRATHLMRRCNKELQLDLRPSSERFGFITLEILRQFPLRYYLNIWLEIRTFLQGHEKCGLRGKGLLLTIKPSKFCCIFKNWVDLQCCFSNSSIWHNNQQPLWSLPPSSLPPSPLWHTGCRRLEGSAHIF